MKQLHHMKTEMVEMLLRQFYTRWNCFVLVDFMPIFYTCTFFVFIPEIMSLKHFSLEFMC